MVLRITTSFDSSYEISRWLCIPLLCLFTAGCSKHSDQKLDSQVATAPQADLARPALTNLYQTGPEVDLLSRIDPERDALRGDFRFTDGGLVFSGTQATQLNFDVDLPEQYELLLAVARLDGEESFNLGIHVGGATTLVVIEGWGRKISGLNLVDGRFGEDNVTSSTLPVFDDASTKLIRVVVRRESVLVDVDGSVFIDFRGSPSRLSFDERFFQRPAANQLMIGGWASSFRVSSWVLKPLGEERVDYAANQPPKTNESSVASVDSGKDKADAPSESAVATSRHDDQQPGTESPAVPVTDPATIKDPPSADVPDVKPAPEPEPARVAWTAKVDPLPGFDPQAEAKAVAVPIRRGWALVPNGRSHFFAVAQTDDNRVHWSVYDLRKGQSVGTRLDLSAENRGLYQLAESGEFLLSYVDVASASRFDVHSFVTGELVHSDSSPDKQPWNHRRDFLTARRGLVSLRGQDGQLHVTRVDLKTGAPTGSWNTGLSAGRHRAVACSPGGRYLIVADKELYVFDLATTETVGQVSFPSGMEAALALAFSGDGRELAVLGSHDDRATPICWFIDWATGQTRLAADVAAELESVGNNYHLGPPLEWFPGGKLLLYYGRDVIDCETGRFCVRIPTNVHWQMPRRAVSDDTLLAMMPTGDINVNEYRDIKIDRKALEQSLQVVRAGGTALDIGLPQLTVVDASGATRLVLSDNTSPLSARLEPKPEFPSGSVKLPLPLLRTRDSKTVLQKFQLASPETALAVAHFHVEPAGDVQPREMLVRYDLRKGKPTGSIPMREDFRLVDVSSDGSRVLLGLANKVDAYSRVDVIDVNGKSHVAGWRPFSNEPFKKDVAASGQPAALNPQTASWARFIDRDRVLTINPEGKLVCWQLPDCVPVYSCDGFMSPYDLSDDRRYLAGTDGQSVHVLDVRAGQWAGRLDAPDTPQQVLRVGFHPEGQELVAIYRYPGRAEIVFGDARTGQVTEQFDLAYMTVSPGWSEYTHPAHRQLGLAYKRDGYLLLDDLYLIDRQHRTTPWAYGLRKGKHAAGDVDNREWFIQAVTTNDNGQVFDWILDAADVPSEEVLKRIQDSLAEPKQMPIGKSILLTEGEQVTQNNQ